MVLLDEGQLLDLSDIPLSHGASHSLAKVFKSCSLHIRTLVIKRGPIGDLQALLVGAKKLRVRQIFLSELELHNCHNALMTLKLKRNPNNMQELSLDKCHISPTALDTLLNSTAMGVERMKTLAMTRMDLGDYKFYPVLTKFMKNKQLRNFTLAKCRVVPAPYQIYLEKLLKNKSYNHLSLSFNLTKPF
jgi:hypothetical protein